MTHAHEQLPVTIALSHMAKRKRKSSQGPKRSRPKGKDGERRADALLISRGWYIADREIQGLAGDDIFARDPDGVWWSVEVKHTNSAHNKFVGQAKRQGAERLAAIATTLSGGHESVNAKVKADIMSSLGMDTYDGRWLILWRPSNWNARSTEWVAATGGLKGYTSFLAPF